MKIAVYEHFTATRALHSPAWIEGNAMLRAVCEDLKNVGWEVQVVDSIPPSKPVDLVLVIAPSIGRTLYNLVKVCEDEGLNVMNSPSTAIFLATDKALLYKNLEAQGIPTPKTIISRFEEALEKAKEALASHERVVVKPADGDGCAGLCVVSSSDEVPSAVSIVKQNSRLPYFLIQELVDGVNLSVSLLASDNTILPLSINLQEVRLGGVDEPSSYIGSVVPHWCDNRVVEVAVKAVKSLGHVKGYFGVDVVLRGGDPYVIEVNPRLTTSYLALREVSEDNIIEMIVKSYFDESSLRPVSLKGKAIVKKLVAETDLSTTSLRPSLPNGARMLSTLIDKRHIIRRGEAYAIYVLRLEDLSSIHYAFDASRP